MTPSRLQQQQAGALSDKAYVQGKLGAQAGRKATFGGRAGPHAAERLKPAAAAFAAGSDDD